MREFKQAIEAHERALVIFRGRGDRQHEGMVLHNLGDALQEVRRIDEAGDSYRQALVISSELGDRHSEAKLLNYLGRALAKGRNFTKAVEAHRQALTVARELDMSSCSCERDALAEIEGIRDICIFRRFWRTSLRFDNLIRSVEFIRII